MHIYSGELDKIVGEREAKATKWGGEQEEDRVVEARR